MRNAFRGPVGLTTKSETRNRALQVFAHKRNCRVPQGNAAMKSAFDQMTRFLVVILGLAFFFGGDAHGWHAPGWGDSAPATPAKTLPTDPSNPPTPPSGLSLGFAMADFTGD